MRPYVSVLLITCLNANIVWSTEYWGGTSRDLLQLPHFGNNEECSYTVDIISEFRYALYDFSTNIFKLAAIESDNHFILSPLSLWLDLAAIAEGSSGDARQELFKQLKLPEDRCIRQQFYAMAISREYPSNYYAVSRKRLLIVDENISLNRQWQYFVQKNNLIDIIALPLYRRPKESINNIRRLTNTQLPNIDSNGNSLLLDTLDYKFNGDAILPMAKVVREPFYNDIGEEIGMVNLIKSKRRVKLAYLPDLKVKVLELLDGDNSRYRLMYAISSGNDSSIEETINDFKNDIILKVLKKLRLSKIPLEVGIPQYTATTETDVKAILEKLGVETLWTDIWATRNISNPPVFPSSFIQRATLTFERPDVRHLVQETSNFVPAIDNVRNEDTGLDEEIGRDFIVNRPFMVGLFDAETYTCLFCSTFSKLSAK